MQKGIMANELEVKPAESQEPSIADMRSMLVSPEPVKEAPAAEPKPAAEPEKPATLEVKPKPEVKAEEKPAAETPADSGPAKETQEQADEGEKGKKFAPKEEVVPEGVQKRLNKITWEKHEEARKREAAEREAAELRKKLADQAAGKPASEKSPDKPAVAFSEAEPAAPKEESFDTYGEYLSAHAKYTDAHALWVTRKDRFEYTAQQQAEQQRQRQEEEGRKAAERQQTATKSWNERVSKLAETKPEISAAIDAVGQFLTETGNAELIMQSDIGPEIVLYMHQHAEETLKIAETGNPGQIARYIGRIEAKIATPETPAPKPQPPAKPLPEPIKAVGGGAAPPKEIDLADPKISMEDFKREAGRQIAAAQQ